MVETNEKWRLLDKNGGKEVLVEVNWNPEDPKTNKCQVFKFIFPDRTTSFVEKKHLLEMFFSAGTEEEQRKLVPTTLTKMRWYETVLSVTAKKDIHKGEQVVFPVKLSLPMDTKEVLGLPKKKSVLLP